MFNRYTGEPTVVHDRTDQYVTFTCFGQRCTMGHREFDMYYTSVRPVPAGGWSGVGSFEVGATDQDALTFGGRAMQQNTQGYEVFVPIGEVNRTDTTRFGVAYIEQTIDEDPYRSIFVQIVAQRLDNPPNGWVDLPNRLLVELDLVADVAEAMLQAALHMPEAS